MERRYHALAKERTMLLRCESLEPPMSQLGHNRNSLFGVARPLSPTADMASHTSRAAMCHNRTHAPQQTASAFNRISSRANSIAGTPKAEVRLRCRPGGAV